MDNSILNISICMEKSIRMKRVNNVLTIELGLGARKPVFGGLGNTGADQPAHLRSLISPFVIRLLESIISRLAMS